MLQEANSWLSANSVPIFAAVIPLVSASVAYFSSVFATKRTIASQKIERNLQRVIKLADFRQDWINELRLEFAQFSGILGRVLPLLREEMNDFSLVFNKILLRMNHADPDFENLSKAMSAAMKSDSDGQVAKASKHAEMKVLMAQILKREWDRLKADLRSSESGGGMQ